MIKELDALDPSFDLIESGKLIRNIAGLIDAAIVLALFVFISLRLPPGALWQLQNPIGPEIYILILLALYRLFFIYLFNATIGMRICSILLLNGNYQNLTLKEKTFAAFFMLVNGTAYYNK